LQKIKQKNENELESLNLKTTQSFNEFRKKRGMELDNLIQKHRNKLRELEVSLKNDLVDYDKLGTSSKILNGVHNKNIAFSSKMFFFKL
jgi:hypothetical protein